VLVETREQAGQVVQVRTHHWIHASAGHRSTRGTTTARRPRTELRRQWWGSPFPAHSNFTAAASGIVAIRAMLSCWSRVRSTTATRL
jgi:hypothetical protein